MATAAAPRALFAINPALDRAALAHAFARDGRVQVRDVLTPDTADEVASILARTPWGLSANPGGVARGIRAEDLARMAAPERHAIGQTIAATVRAGGYGFAFQHYPMVDAHLGRWRPGGPHDLILEHLNDAPFLALARAVTGIHELVKADAQATLFGPNQFLGLHIDSHVAQGWRVAYTLNFARDWQPDWGGYLYFHDDDGDVIAGWKPRFNALNLFAVPRAHSVGYVPPFAPPGRLAITGWLRDR